MIKATWTHEPATVNTDAAWMMAGGEFYVVETAPGTFTVNRTDGEVFEVLCTLYDLDGAKQAAEIALTLSNQGAIARRSAALIEAATKAYRTLTDAQSVCRDVRNAFPADDGRAEFATKMLSEIMAAQRAIDAALNGEKD